MPSLNYPSDSSYPSRHQGHVQPLGLGVMEEVPEVVVGAGVDGVDGRVRGEGPVGVRAQRVQHGAEVGVVLSPAGQRLREIRTQVR